MSASGAEESVVWTPLRRSLSGDGQVVAPLSTIIEIPHLRSRFFPRLIEACSELLEAGAVSAHAVALAVDL
jgi:hypothetical protein